MVKICSIEDCESKAIARGWCGAHYQRWSKHGDPFVVLAGGGPRSYDPICSIDDCKGKHFAKGWCRKHYMRWSKHGDPFTVLANQDRDPTCSIEGCEGKHSGKGWCSSHYKRWKRYGDPTATGHGTGRKPHGLDAQDTFQYYSNDKAIDSNGCWMPNLPSTSNGYFNVSIKGRRQPTSLHRLALAVTTGFDLDSKESVHHMCANRSCFNPDHLQPVTARENVAEMRERNFYLAEIERLEAIVWKFQLKAIKGIFREISVEG